MFWWFSFSIPWYSFGYAGFYSNETNSSQNKKVEISPIFFQMQLRIVFIGFVHKQLLRIEVFQKVSAKFQSFIQEAGARKANNLWKFIEVYSTTLWLSGEMFSWEFFAKESWKFSSVWCFEGVFHFEGFRFSVYEHGFNWV